MVPDLRLHDLRRTTYSELQILGAPPHVCSAVLGHVEQGSADSDAHYAHGERFEEHAAWLSKWAEKVERLIGEGEPGALLPFTKRRGKRG